MGNVYQAKQAKKGIPKTTEDLLKNSDNIISAEMLKHNLSYEEIKKNMPYWSREAYKRITRKKPENRTEEENRYT